MQLDNLAVLYNIIEVKKYMFQLTAMNILMERDDDMSTTATELKVNPNHCSAFSQQI